MIMTYHCQIYTENFFNEGSPHTLHFVPGKATEPVAPTIKPDIGVSDVLTSPPQGPLTAHGQVSHDQCPPTPERHPPGFLSELSPETYVITATVNLCNES